MKLLFDIGDIVETDLVKSNRGQIIGLRSANVGYPPMPGADILCKDGQVRFKYLHDLARYNPEKLEALT